MTILEETTRHGTLPVTAGGAGRSPSAEPAAPGAGGAAGGRLSGLIDPTPVAVALLAVQLAVFAVRWLGATPAHLGDAALETALIVATLAAGGGQLLAGVFGYLRGDKYVSHVAAVVGLWLFGLYFLTSNDAMEPASVGWYNIFLAVLLAIIMVPAVVKRMYAFICAFSSISAVLVLSGLGFLSLQAAEDAGGAADLSTAAGLLNASAWFAFIGAASLLWILAKTLYAESNVLGLGGSEDD
ncbi:hypothetical protein [Tomitella cavernea]|uniref:GPR1/FUN34/yaaH family protein n=1 Tax=Tomitella cavernea TaxID=1387982 RepID=A0ABP9C2J2_9ACTN|nr:hypothetical protein [Tomitella cavernea]